MVAVRKVVVGFTHWRRPDGESRVVNLIGSEAGSGTHLPTTAVASFAAYGPVTIDRSNASDLGVAGRRPTLVGSFVARPGVDGNGRRFAQLRHPAPDEIVQRSQKS